MTDEKLKYIYRQHKIVKALVAGIESVSGCGLKDYSPYLKKADKEVSLYNVFTGGTFSPVKKILIVGNKGVGKTTLTKSILYSWAGETLWNDKFNAVYTVDLRLLLNDSWDEEYDGYDIDDPKVMLQCLIHHSICSSFSGKPRKAIKIEPEDIVLFDESKILLILDGYDDEIKELNEFKDLSSLIFQWENVIVTADPESITPQDEKKYDTKIEHLGVSDTGINDYKKLYFSNCSYSSFDTFLNRNEWARDLCRIPVNLFILCYLYKDGGTPECKTVSDVYFHFIKKLSNSYIQKNWPGFEERGQLFVASLCRLFAYSADKMNEDPIKGMINRENRSELSIQGHINYLSDHQLISTNSGGIISLQKIGRYGLLQPLSPKKARSAALETDLRKSSFVFDPFIREYLSSCNTVCILFGNDLKAKKDIRELINTQKYEESYLTQLKYVSGILGIIEASGEVSKFFIRVGIIKNNDDVKRALRIFWQDITYNVYTNYESEDISRRAVMLMTLLGELQPNQIIDANIENSEKLVDFIDIIILFDFLGSFTSASDITSLQWVTTLKSSNYISARVKEFVLAGLSGELNSLYNKFNSMRISSELSECFAYFKQKLKKVLELEPPAGNVADKIKESCFHVISNHWNQFDSSAFSGALSSIFSQLGEYGEKAGKGEKENDLNWGLIRSAMSCQLKMNNPKVNQAANCITAILNQSYISDVDVKFIGLISEAGIFADKETTNNLKSTPITSYLLPKSNIAYSDIGIQYVLHFLQHVNREDGLWEGAIGGLYRYYSDKNSYIKFSAIKSSVTLVLQLKYKEFYEDITDKLLKLINDSSEGVKILVIESLFDVMRESGDQDLIENCASKLMRSIPDSSDFVRPSLMTGISNLMISIIGKDFSQELIEDNISKLTRLLPDQSDVVKSSIVECVTKVLISSIGQDFSQELIENNISKLTRCFTDQSDVVKPSIVKGITKVLISSIGQDFSQELIEDNISKLMRCFTEQSDVVKPSIVKGITKVLVSTIGQDFSQELIEDNISKLMRCFTEQSDVVRPSIVEGVTKVLVSTIGQDFSQELIEDNILQLINYVSDKEVYLSTVIIKNINTIAAQILLSISGAWDVSKKRDILEVLDQILKVWCKYLSCVNDDLRLPIIDSVTEIIVKSYIRTEDLDIIGMYDKVLDILYNCASSDNMSVQLSAIDGIVGISAALEKSDELTEKLLPQLIRCFSNRNTAVVLSAIDGVCAIGASLSSKWKDNRPGVNDNKDYVFDKLLPEVIKCFLNKSIDNAPIQRGLVKMLASSNNMLNSMDILYGYFGNKNICVVLSTIETSTEIILNLLPLGGPAKNLLENLQDCFDNPDPNIVIAAMKSATEIVLAYKDLGLAKSLLDFLGNRFDNSDHNIITTAMKSATEIVLVYKDLAKPLLNTLQACFNDDNPTITLLALEASSEIIIKLRNKDSARNLLMYLLVYYDDDNVIIQVSVKKAANKILKNFNNDSELKRYIPITDDDKPL